MCRGFICMFRMFWGVILWEKCVYHVSWMDAWVNNGHSQSKFEYFEKWKFWLRVMCWKFVRMFCVFWDVILLAKCIMYVRIGWNWPKMVIWGEKNENLEKWKFGWWVVVGCVDVNVGCFRVIILMWERYVNEWIWKWDIRYTRLHPTWAEVCP